MGIANFQGGGWFMLVAPAATPSAIVERLFRELRGALADPAVRSDFIGQGIVPVDSDPPHILQVFVRDQIAFWKDTLTRLGLAGME
jgi:tripartite-type tricarboxylate transporter receptor subunit TctC